MFKIGDKVLTWTGKQGTIIQIRDGLYYVFCESDLSYNAYKENELKIDEKYYKTLIYNRRKKKR